jgi:P27 family predicted phage terminase small subunit
MKGRKPKLAAVRILEGNPSRRPIVQPPDPGGELRMPSALNEAERKVWRRLIPGLQRIGAASALDRYILSDICRCIVRLDEAEAEITARGLVIESERTDKTGNVVHELIRNPACLAAKEYRAALTRYATEFGLTAISRTKLAAPAEPKNALDELLG